MNKEKAFELTDTKNDNQLAKITGYSRQYVGTWKGDLPIGPKIKVLQIAGLIPEVMPSNPKKAS